MAYSRTTTVDPAPAGDTTKQAVLDVDTDLTGIFTNLNTHEALATGIHGVGAGTICGTATTDTLTNKTLSSPTLTGTVTASGATITGGTTVNQTIQTPTITGAVTASGATITGGNTVNQTITTPTITGGTSTNLTLVTPALGTPASGVVTNLTGTAAGVTAGGIDDNTLITTPSITGGTATNLTLVTPALGTPASGVVTNLTGTAAGVTAGGIDDNTLITTPSITGGTATNLTLVTPALGTPTAGVVTNLTGTAAGVTAGGIDASSLIETPSITGGTATNLALVTPTSATLTAPAASLVIKPTTDATTAVQIADKDGNVIFNVDTTNNRVGIGQTAVEPSQMLQIDDGNIALSDTNVAHGLTDVAATNVMGLVKQRHALSGGLQLVGITDTDMTPVIIDGIIGSTTATNTTRAILLRGGVSNGTTSWTTAAATEAVFGLQNFTTDLVTVFGNGNLTATGTIQATTALLTNLTDLKVPKHVADATGLADTTITVSANNEVTNASQPAFLAYASSDQNDIAVGGNVTVVFGAEALDQNADFATNTFTAPVTGVYALNTCLQIQNMDSASTEFDYYIVTSNRTFYGFYIPSKELSADGSVAFNLSVICDMDAADTAFVRVYQTGGAQQTDILTNSYFSGALLC